MKVLHASVQKKYKKSFVDFEQKNPFIDLLTVDKWNRKSDDVLIFKVWAVRELQNESPVFFAKKYKKSNNNYNYKRKRSAGTIIKKRF